MTPKERAANYMKLKKGYKMKQTAVEWLVEELQEANYIPKDSLIMKYVIDQAKEMENEKKLINQLFIGKVLEIIGFEKTIQLLKEAKETYKK